MFFCKKPIIKIWLLVILLFTIKLYAQQLPVQIPDLFLWLKADAGVQLNGGSVSTWNDFGPFKINFIQNTATFQPQWVNTSSMNGKPYVTFDGIDDILFSDSLISLNDISVFIVASQYANDNYGRFMDHDANNGFWIGRNGNLNEIGGGFKDPSWPYGNYVAKNDGDVFLLSMARSNDTAFSYNNNTSFPSPYRITSSGPTTLNKISLGGNINSAQFGKKNIFEVIVFKRNLSQTERAEIELYLANKYFERPSLNSLSMNVNSNCPLITNWDATNFPGPYLWNNSASTANIPVSNSDSLYILKAKNSLGLWVTDTLIITSDYNYKSDTFICPFDTLIWSVNIGAGATYTWSNGSNSSTQNFWVPGTYSVTSTNFSGCVFNDSLKLLIDNSLTSISLGTDTNLCAGNAIYLKTGNQPGLNYTWNDGTHNDSLYVNTTGQYYTIVTNTNNCIAKDTINVTVIGQAPIAAFINSATCKNNSVSFTDNSIPPSGNTISSWLWNFGDGTTLADTSIIQNPFYTYADTGNYQIHLSITTNAGCKQTAIKNIHVAPKPVANFNNIISCQNDSALFTNLSTSPSAYVPLSYSWNFGDPASGSANTSTLTNPKHSFSQQINYVVKLVTTNNAGCKDSLSKNILVKAEVTADFTYTSPCTNAPIIFQDNSTVPAPNNLNTRLWTIGTSTISGLTVTRSFTSSGLYSVSLKVTGYNSCISTVTKVIDVKLPPVADFSLTSICHKDTAIANDLSAAQNGSITSWTWSLDNVPFSSAQNATLSPIATTNYAVKLTVKNNYTCKDSLTKSFTVYPLPAVDFTTSSPYYYPNTPVIFYPTNTGGIAYDWNINNTLYPIFSPTVSFASTGTYTAHLSMKNNFGCINTKTKTLSVVDYFFDLAVLAVRANKSNDNYITVEADIGNVGSAKVSNFEIYYQIADAAKVKEEWQGNLNPGGFLTYTFNSNALQKSTEGTFITCVNLGLVNGNNDSNLNNNFSCSPSDLSEITVYEPYPNPSDENTTLSIILPADMEINLDVVDELGQGVYMNKIVSGKQGLNLVTIPMSDLSKATYLVKITIGDKVFVKKLLKAKR